MSNQPSPWNIDWTPEVIARFWDWYAQHDLFRSRYFSAHLGWSIIDHIGPYLTSPVVEIGAGGGDLTRRFLDRGLSTLTLDLSPETVAALADRFREVPGFLGARRMVDTLPLEDDYAGSVILCETIEHLTEETWTRLVSDIRRVLKPSGRLIITTPNDEDLTNATVMCPHCACVFHSVQHLRSFSRETLRSLMEGAGFRTVTCRATFFTPLTGFHARLEWMRRTLQGYPKPHLLYVGERI